MKEDLLPVLDYRSIRPDRNTESNVIPALISLWLAAVPFIIWALHCHELAVITFLLLPWLGAIPFNRVAE
jgi:hypothetical protein